MTDRGIAMVVLEVMGGIIAGVLILAAIYDQRARRHGWSPGPDESVARRLSVDDEGPFPQRGKISGSGFRPPHETERRGQGD